MLKVVKREGSPYFYLRGTVAGQSVFEGTKTSDPAQAEGYRIKREAELWNESVHGKRAVCTFAAAASSYLTFEPRTLSTIDYVDRLLAYFGTTLISKIDQSCLDGAYKSILKKGVETSPDTKIRAVITPLQAILMHANSMGWCDRPAFKKPKATKTRVRPLFPHQAERLILAASPHLQPLLTFMAGTGVRLSEALDADSEGSRPSIPRRCRPPIPKYSRPLIPRNPRPSIPGYCRPALRG